MASEAGSLRLEGKTALVTGGAQGIGEAVAERFCEEGARVVIADIQEEKGHATAARLRAAGHSAHFALVDMAEVRQVGSMVGNAAAELGGHIDVLANNAGAVLDRSIAKMTEDEWRFVLGVNLRGPVFCMQAVAAVMVKAATRGSIINAASIAGIDGNFGQTAYSASKGGIISATRTAAKELASKGIRVNAIAPGFIATPMTETIPDESLNAIVGRIPLGRQGMPEDVAGLYTFLASDDASYVTGAVYRVDGGLTL